MANPAYGSRSPKAVSKPFFDGRCEWHRGGAAIGGNLFLRPQPECQNKAPAGVQWCDEHRCVEEDCTLARVKDDRCVRHQPGSLWLARQAGIADR